MRKCGSEKEKEFFFVLARDRKIRPQYHRLASRGLPSDDKR